MQSRNQKQHRLRLHAYFEFTATRDTDFLERVTFVVYAPIIAGMTGLNLGLPTAWVVKRKKCGCNDQLPLP